MDAKTVVAAGVAGVAAAGLVARSLVRKTQESEGDSRHPEGWKSVTVLGDAETFRGHYPQPLQLLESVLDIRVEPAPADKGFEVHARLREDADAADATGDVEPEQALRAALRDAKQIFETGEVLRATPRPHGHRPTTLFGAAVDKAEDDSKGGGVL